MMTLWLLHERSKVEEIVESEEFEEPEESRIFEEALEIETVEHLEKIEEPVNIEVLENTTNLIANNILNRFSPDSVQSSFHGFNSDSEDLLRNQNMYQELLNNDQAQFDVDQSDDD